MAGILGVTTTTASELTQLLAGDVYVMKTITIPAGVGTVSRGELLAQLTADYSWTKFNHGGSDGSEIPRAICAEAADATLADKNVVAYFVGHYRLSDIVWPDGISAAQKNAAIQALQDRGIILE